MHQLLMEMWINQLSSSNEQVATEVQATESDTKAGSNNVPLYLSIVALIAGLLSLGISLKKRG